MRQISKLQNCERVGRETIMHDTLAVPVASSNNTVFFLCLHSMEGEAEPYVSHN